MAMEIKKGSLSHILLTVLEKSIDGFVKYNDFRQHPSTYMYYGGRDVPKSALSKAISRLKGKKFIIGLNDNSGETILKLTDAGRSQLISSHEVEEIWDGKLRIVIFDIPEQKRVIRNLFRRNIKKWGFKPLQKSVWVSKKNVMDKLMNYIKDLKMEQWVIVFESDKFGPLDIL